jgi:hypothetical protein
MALTPEEQLELQTLEEQQSTIGSQYEKLKQQMQVQTQAEIPTPETGMVESLARGAAQGLTFDTADELAALLESGLTNKPYEKALEESRAEYKAAEEQYPISSVVGGLAGGIGQTAALAGLTGGLGATAGAAQTGSKLAKLGSIAKSAFLPSVSKSAIQNVGTAARTGALMGGLTAIGASEKEGLARLQEAPGGVMTGGIVGGVLGGVLEGAKGATKVAGEKLSKAIDEGDLPYSFRKIRDLWRSGKQGQGYVTEKSLKGIDTKFQDASEESVDLIQKNLDELRTIKNTILENVDESINIDTPISNLMSGLQKSASENLADAEPALKRVEGLYQGKMNVIVNENGDISAKSANDLASQLEDYLQSNPQASEEIKKLFKNAIKDIKLNLRFSIKPEKAYLAIQNNPEILQNYVKHVQNIPESSIQTSNIISPEEKKFVANLKASLTRASKKPDYVPQTVESAVAELNAPVKKGRGRPKKAVTVAPADLDTPENLKAIEEAQAMAKQVMQESAAENPLTKLDVMMHNILNASESLGGITRGQGTDLKRKFKVFDVMRGATSETGSGQKAFMKYQQAISDLEKADPKLATAFKELTEPRIIELENKKFLEGAKLGEGPREGTVIKQFVTGPTTQIVGQAANIMAQPGFKLPRLGLSGLNYMKQQIDDRLAKSPESITYKTFSDSLQRAIESKDEARRAAILNTLMQYKTFRELFKTEE